MQAGRTARPRRPLDKREIGSVRVPRSPPATSRDRQENDTSRHRVNGKVSTSKLRPEQIWLFFVFFLQMNFKRSHLFSAASRKLNKAVQHFTATRETRRANEGRSSSFESSGGTFWGGGHVMPNLANVAQQTSGSTACGKVLSRRILKVK